MILSLLALFVILASAEPIPASKAAQDEIVKQVKIGMKAYKEYLVFSEEESFWREKFDLEGSLDAEDVQKWYAAERERQNRLAKMNERFNEAVKLTRSAYQVNPASVEKAIKGGPIDQMTAKWEPKFFHERMRNKGMKDKSGDWVFLRDEFKGRGGTTLANGEVLVHLDPFMDAIKYGNPGALAYVLYHESVHFQDLVTKGWSSRSKIETDAYGKSLKRFNVFFDKQKYPVQYADWNSVVEDGLSEAKTSLSKRPMFPYPEEAQEKAAVEWMAEELKRQAVEKAREELKSAALRKHVEYLREVAALACSGTTVSQASLDKLGTLTPKDMGYTGQPPESARCAEKLYFYMFYKLRTGDGLPVSDVNGGARHFLEEDRRRDEKRAPQTIVVPPPSLTPPAPDMNEAAQQLKERQYRQEQVRLSRTWLRNMAEKACANPSSMDDETEKTIHVAYGWLSRDGGEFGIAEPREVSRDLAGCQRALLDRILRDEGSGVAVPAGYYRDIAAGEAERHRPPPPPYQGGDSIERGGRGGGDDGCFNQPGLGKVCPANPK